MRVFLFVIDGFGVWNKEHISTYQRLNNNRPLNWKCYPFLYTIGLRNAISGTGNLLSPESTFAGSLEGHREMMGYTSCQTYDILEQGIPDSILDLLSKKYGISWMGNIQGRGKNIIPEYSRRLKSSSVILYCGYDSTVSISFRVHDYKMEDILEYANALMDELANVGIKLRKIIIREYDDCFQQIKRRKEVFYKVDFDETIRSLGFSNIFFNSKIQDILNIQQVKVLDCQTDLECIGTFKSLPLKQDSFYFINFPDFDENAHKGDYNQCALALERFDSFVYNFWKNMQIDDFVIITSDHGVNIGESDLSNSHVLECVPFICFTESSFYQYSGIKKGFGNIYKTIINIKKGHNNYDSYSFFEEKLF